MRNVLYASRALVGDLAGSLLFAVLLSSGVPTLVAAAAGIATAIGTIVFSHLRGMGIGVLQWLSLVLVVAAGAATIMTNDARFVMVKPTLVYIVLGLVMLKPGWMTRYIPPIAVEHIPDVTRAFGFIWSGLMFLTAAVNLYFAVWHTAAWPTFAAIFPLWSKIVLFIAQYAVSRSITIRRKASRALQLEQHAAAT